MFTEINENFFLLKWLICRAQFFLSAWNSLIEKENEITWKSL